MSKSRSKSKSRIKSRSSPKKRGEHSVCFAYFLPRRLDLSNTKRQSFRLFRLILAKAPGRLKNKSVSIMSVSLCLEYPSGRQRRKTQTATTTARNQHM